MRQIYLNVLVCSLVNDLILFWTGKRLLSSASWFLHNGIALFHNMVSYSICSSGFLKWFLQQWYLETLDICKPQEMYGNPRVLVTISRFLLNNLIFLLKLICKKIFLIIIFLSMGEQISDRGTNKYFNILRLGGTRSCTGLTLK